MDTSKILSAPLLDIVFDNRNKDYGAYDLRRTYTSRLARAIVSTAIITAVIIFCTQLSGKNTVATVPIDRGGIEIKPFVEKRDIIPPAPERRTPVTPRPRTVSFTTLVTVDDDRVSNRMATIDELTDALPGPNFTDGPPGRNIVPSIDPGPGGTVIDPAPAPVSDDPVRNAQVPSKFVGDWIKFLVRNLNPEVPVDNHAPPGRYTVLIEFVVDREGKVSDIRPLTKVGYGMEEEAIRVLKRASNWEPALQNGIAVKAYHRQPITFQVLGDE